MEVDDVHATEATLREAVDHVVGHDAGILKRGVVGLADDAHHLAGVLAEVLRHLTAAGNELDLLRTVTVEVLDALLSGALDLHVETAGKTTVGADRNDQRALVGLGVHEERRVDVERRIGRHGEHDVGDRGGVRLAVLGALQGTRDLRRGDHFHGARDLLGRGDRTDALFYFAEVGHRAYYSPASSATDLTGAFPESRDARN